MFDLTVGDDQLQFAISVLRVIGKLDHAVDVLYVLLCHLHISHKIINARDIAVSATVITAASIIVPAPSDSDKACRRLLLHRDTRPRGTSALQGL